MSVMSVNHMVTLAMVIMVMEVMVLEVMDLKVGGSDDGEGNGGGDGVDVTM